MTQRLPPHAPEAEQALIGCCLTSPVECIPQVQAVLAAEAFYELRNRTIWELIVGMEPSTVNIITVHQRLKDAETLANIGGIEYLNACCDSCISAANIESWIADVGEKFTRRKIITACTLAVGLCYEPDNSVTLLDTIETRILSIRPNQKKSNTIKALVGLALNKIEEKFNNPDAIGGLSTGLIDLDKISDGMHGGEMIVIAGFPSTGKTALAVNIAVECAINQIPAAIFSAEMRPVQLVIRSLCSNSRVNYHKPNESQSGLEKMVPEAQRLANAPLFIEPANGMTIGQVQAVARRLKQKHDIKIMVIDYIQLIQGVGDNRELQVSSISKGIKDIALELGIPILALSQLNDNGQMRESRAIGQDADTVWKLANEGDWKPDIQPINLEISKCRDGETGVVPLTFVKIYTRFESRAKIADEDVG